MSALIKSGDSALAARVRPMLVAGSAAEPPTARVSPEVVRLSCELTAAVEERDRLAGELVSARAEMAPARQAAEALGRERGRAEAEDRASERLGALKSALERGLQQVDSRLSGLEALAAVLAEEGLTRVLGDGAEQAPLVTRIIVQQAEALRRAAVVSVEVSDLDFTPERLDDLARELSEPRAEISARGDVGSGECRVRLALGAVEIGPKRQLERIREVLRALAFEEVPA